MSKSLFVILLVPLFFFGSCQKEETLLPIEYPGLLANRIDRVSVLDDGTLLVMNSEGIFVRYPDNTTSVISYNFNETDLRFAYDMKFLVGNDVIYGVDESNILEITRNGYSFYSSEFLSNGLLAHPEYVITTDNELLKVSYGSSRYNQNLNVYEWAVKISKWESRTWLISETDLYVPDIYSATTPVMAFASSSTAYLHIDKLYELAYKDFDDISFEEIVAINGTITDNSFYEMTVFGNEIIGFNRILHEYANWTGSFSRSNMFNATTGKLSSNSPSSSCGVEPFGTFSFDQYLGYDGATAFFYNETVFNLFSTEDKRGELYSYDLESGTCDLDIILAVGALQGVEVDIIDVDIDPSKNEIYLGTSRGLYIYDRLAHSVEHYLDNLINEK